MLDQNTNLVLPDINFDDEIQEASEPFLGIVVLDQYEPDNRNAGEYKWHLGVKPVRFAVKGETGCFHFRARHSLSARSSMGKFMLALKKANGGKPTGLKAGNGGMLGFVAWWVRKEEKFTASDGTEGTINLLLVVKLADDAEKAEAGTGGITPAEPPPPPSYSDDQIEAMLEVMEGKTPSDFQIAAIKSRLPQELKTAVMNGTALRSLQEKGIVDLNNGVVARLVAA